MIGFATLVDSLFLYLYTYQGRPLVGKSEPDELKLARVAAGFSTESNEGSMTHAWDTAHCCFEA